MNKEISLKKYIFVLTILVILELAIMFGISYNKKEETKEYCKNAVCNKDATLCYVYELDDKGNTIITWRGDCSSN